MSETTLRPCPCGKTPSALLITDGHTCKWAWASGDCCNEWHIEFRTDYFPLGDERLMAKAVDAWNLTPRPAPTDADVRRIAEKHASGLKEVTSETLVRVLIESAIREAMGIGGGA